MTLIDFNSSLETFAMDFLQSNDAAGYSKAVIDLINEFTIEQLKKSKEELVIEMLNFVTTTARSGK